MITYEWRRCEYVLVLSDLLLVSSSLVGCTTSGEFDLDEEGGGEEMEEVGVAGEEEELSDGRVSELVAILIRLLRLLVPYF